MILSIQPDSQRGTKDQPKSFHRFPSFKKPKNHLRSILPFVLYDTLNVCKEEYAKTIQLNLF